MTANKAEWVVALASVATGLFVGWQAWEIRRAFNTPFQANIQLRQFDACLEFVSASQETVFRVQNYHRDFVEIADDFSEQLFGSADDSDGGTPDAVWPSFGTYGLSKSAMLENLHTLQAASTRLNGIVGLQVSPDSTFGVEIDARNDAFSVNLGLVNIAIDALIFHANDIGPEDGIAYAPLGPNAPEFSGASRICR